MSHSKHSRAPIAVIGIGNYFLSDEGAGIHAVDRLRERNLPEHIEIIDGATAGAGLRFFIENRDRVIFIDCGDFGGGPGEYICFRPNEAESTKKLDGFSLHEFDLMTFLNECSADPIYPDDISVYCIQAVSIEPGDTLSPEVDTGIDKIVDEICLDLAG